MNARIRQFRRWASTQSLRAYVEDTLALLLLVALFIMVLWIGFGLGLMDDALIQPVEVIR